MHNPKMPNPPSDFLNTGYKLKQVAHSSQCTLDFYSLQRT